ncbi:MAG TPA: biotin synthase BioB [Nitrospira sp.]|jgi:biotin synthase|nr:biotin synthase BioB [Nitrospira sp.]MBS0164059.1 biotin synthase BioB [Nitrospira sp.]MBS0174716.1 biotin synthase BioB [Nitrospira sp.]MBX3336610.1 biotin synthase BioB [Nitrospira sp.]MCW5779143.1 biotin synthase BioB [Nitrospira sp.]
MIELSSLAEKALRDEPLTHEESLAVLQTPDSRLLELLQAAFTVRERYFGKTVRLQMLMNAKSGACQEDCGYCSQSAVSKAPIERYGLLPPEQMLTGARRAAAAKAQRYCIVISGRSPLDRDIAEVASAVRSIKQEVPIQICCSLGLLNEGQAKDLKAAGVDRINHNLNTSEAYHSEICTTHTFQDRLATIRHARTAGLEICSGGIVGMGERDEDLIDLALALREVKPDSIPLNMLHPASGTPMEHCTPLTPQRCLKALCLFRFLHPRTEIRIAGGREHNLRSLQPLALYPADSVFVNGYLTTPGQPAAEVWRMIEDLGFEIQVDALPLTQGSAPATEPAVGRHS